MANDAREKLAGILRLQTDELARDVTRANEILARIGKGKDIGDQIAQNISAQIKKGIENGIKDAKIPDIGSGGSGGSGGKSSGSKTSDTSMLSSQLQQTKQIYQMSSLMGQATARDAAALKEKVELSRKYLDDLRNSSKFSDDQLTTLQDRVKIQEKENSLLVEQAKHRKSIVDNAQKEADRAQKETDDAAKKSQEKAEANIAQLLKKQVELTKEKASAEAKSIVSSGEQAKIYKQISDNKKEELKKVKEQIEDQVKTNAELSKSEVYIKGNEKVRQAEAQATEKVSQAEAKAADNASKHNKFLITRTDLLDKIQLSLIHIVTQAATRALAQFWQEAWKYASEYYDKMNEIRIVTGKTEQESAAIGTSLRNLAREMSVSSREMAEGAITFYRQGLGDDEVNKRLIATTEYAKTAGLSFEQSADMITATVNTIEKDGRGMEMTAQRVADVFLYLGDNAATSGEEIGTAMSRSASLADAAGVSFEMLGAYIATVSERTRQDAGTIGTALNAIMSRLTSVKQKGFNEEDETKVNDVAKALASVNVQLTDGQGEWRRIEDIFMDVAKVWDTLDDKTRNYLATVMAGTRQQNVFRTLMADLSNVATGTSRAMELYEGAMNSAGTAAEKYAVYQESVTAAHDKMTASLEKLFSLFDSNIMKQLYNVGGGIAEGIYSLFAGPEEYNYSNVVGVLEDQQAAIQSAMNKYEELAKKQKTLAVGSAEYNAVAKEMNDIITKLASQYGPFGDLVAAAGGSFANADEAIAAMNGSLEDLLELVRQFRAAELERSIGSAVEGVSVAYDNRRAAGYNSVIRDRFGSFLQQNGINQTDSGAMLDAMYAFDPDKVFADYANDDDFKMAYANFMEGLRKDVVAGWQQFRTETEAAAVDAVAGPVDNLKKQLIASVKNTEFYAGLTPVMRDAFINSVTSALSFDTNQVSDGKSLYQAMLGIIDNVTNWFKDENNPAMKEVEDAYASVLSLKDKDLSISSEDDAGLVYDTIHRYAEAVRAVGGAFSEEEEIAMADRFWSGVGISTGAAGEAAGEATEKYKELQKALEDVYQSAIGRQLLESGFDGVEANLLSAFGENGFNRDAFFGQLDTLRNAGVSSNFFGQYPGLEEAIANYSHAYDLNEGEEGFSEKARLEAEALAEIEEILRNGADAWSVYAEAEKQALLTETTEDQERQAAALLATAESYDDLTDKFNRLSPAQQSWASKNLKSLKEVLRGTKDYDEAIQDIRKDSAKLNADKLADVGKVWSNTSNIIEAASKGGQEFNKVYASTTKEVQKLQQAWGAYNALSSGTLTDAQDLTDAYNTLASATGLNADSLRDDLSPALELLQNETLNAQGSVEYLANYLAGMTTIDLSNPNWYSQLQALAGSTDETTMHVASLVNALLEAAGASLYLDGNTVKVNWGKGNYTPPSVTKSKRSGGGGGGSRSKNKSSGSNKSSSSSSNNMTEIEKMLDLMSQMEDLLNYHRSMIQEIADIYEGKGEYTNLIAVYGEQREAIEKHNQTLRENIDRIEALLPSQQALVASMRVTDDGYEDAADDLDKLQKAHQQYKKELLENVAALDNLTKAQIEAENARRQKTIDVENMILEAIEDREALEERMLNGRVDMEETVMDILVQRYERERDYILENAELQRDALQEQMSLLDENLAKRKKLTEEDDKYAELQRLEAQLARISADPTRRSESLELRQKIADLRDEIAWNTAENEVEAQKDSIQQQIDSLDDYMDYVERYYEDLFAHPKKLIAEVEEILSKTNEEILAWLEENDENYQNSSVSTQEKTRAEWMETLRDMRGDIVTHWAEVHDIMAQGEDYIINFLIQNSANYRAASAVQASAYVDEWKVKLSEMQAAYRSTYEMISAYNYSLIQQAQSVNSAASSYSPSSYGGGGGSGGGGGGGSKTYKVGVTSSTGKDTIYYSGTDLAKAKQAYAGAASSMRWKIGFKEGGIANFTGPAWLDGTPNAPERVLSPYQTELFEDLIQTLHNVRVAVSSPAVFTPQMRDAGMSGNTFGDIIINVDTLSDDADYEEVATRVMEEIADRMNFGSAIGGLRYGR